MSQSEHHPVILTYHSIAEGPSPIEISPRLFAEQMEWLAENARVASTGEVADTLKGSKPLPKHTVILTFDDGYLDFFEHAAPELLRRKFTAIVFLPTAFVGRSNQWEDSGAGEKPLMQWTHVQELAAKGIEFGSHTVNHPRLTEISGDEIDRELKESRETIQAKTGRAPQVFCYPYGCWNAAVREQVKQFYAAACITGAGVVEPDSDPYALPRVDAHYVRDMNRFRALFTENFEKYVRVRRWIRRLRGAPEGKVAHVASAKESTS